jgi:hypothetical protein
MLIAVIAMMSASAPMAKPSDQPTEIRIQVMDSRTHRPLKRKRVDISFFDENGGVVQPPKRIGKTGSDGVVVLNLKQPIPPRMGVGVWGVYLCTTQPNFPTQAILQDGVITSWKFGHGGDGKDKRCTAKSKAPQPQREPGRIILFGQTMNMSAPATFTEPGHIQNFPQRVPGRSY